MRRTISFLAGAALLSGTFVAVTASPASAGVSTSVAGTVVTATVTGDANVYFDCSSGHVAVTGAVTSPLLACSALTSMHVNGDSAAQTAIGTGLDAAAFSAHPNLVANLGGGSDSAWETSRSDTIDLGPGDDRAFLKAGSVANASVALGTGTNTLEVSGTAANDVMTITSTSANASVASNNGAVASVSAATSVANLYVYAGDGNDTLNAAGITAASTITSTYFSGEAGNDTLTSGVKGAQLAGGPGTNTFNGGTGRDLISSASVTDTIHTGAGPDSVSDESPGRSGGRAIDGSGPDEYSSYQFRCDSVARVRPGASAGMVLTSSLCRPGIASLSSSFDRALLSFGFGPGLPSRGLLDVVIPGSQRIDWSGDVEQDDLMDVTVPTGTWTVFGTAPGDVSVGPDAPGLGNVYGSNVGAVSVHGPWTNKDQGFAHRVVRDLLFRFPTPSARDAIRDQLASHAKTRPQVIASLMDTDEYRGLDVDRVFVQFLKRQPDAAGRTYWINGLHNGKSLRKFRAQLFGSNEYFAKAGGTNEQFVEAAYLDVLGRLPDPAGKTYWVNKINNGTGRGSVANAFLASTEARRNIVKDQYLRFVGRNPFPAEADQWIATLGPSATGEQDLIAFLAASGTYYTAG